jgi:hypothetical protein
MIMMGGYRLKLSEQVGVTLLMSDGLGTSTARIKLRRPLGHRFILSSAS